MRKKRILDDLPPEVLSLVLSQLLPQDMLVQRCSRRWRDKDLDVLYWKPLFLNTFGEAGSDDDEGARPPRRGAASGGIDTSGRGCCEWTCRANRHMRTGPPPRAISLELRPPRETDKHFSRNRWPRRAVRA